MVTEVNNTSPWIRLDGHGLPLFAVPLDLFLLGVDELRGNGQANDDHGCHKHGVLGPPQLPGR